MTQARNTRSTEVSSGRQYSRQEFWYRTPAASALERAVVSAVLSFVAGEAALLVWDRTREGLFGVSLDDSGDSEARDPVGAYLTVHPGLSAQLRRGTTLTIPGRESGTTWVILPLTARGETEGILWVSTLTAPGPETTAALKGACQLAGQALAALRDRDSIRRCFSSALHDMAAPLTAARGYARLILGDPIMSPDQQRIYLTTVLENLNLMVQLAVRMRRCEVEDD
jgi:hypothetical protein